MSIILVQVFLKVSQASECLTNEFLPSINSLKSVYFYSNDIFGCLQMEKNPRIVLGSLLILPREPVSDGVLEYTIHLAPFEIGVLEWDQSTGRHSDRLAIVGQNIQIAS